MNIMKQAVRAGSLAWNMRIVAFLVFVFAIFVSAESAQAAFTCGTNTVSAGGHTYTTKLAPDGKCWTSQNMKHGAVYGWCGGEAMYSATPSPSSAVCTALGSGWRIPTLSDWQNLVSVGATGWLGNKLFAMTSTVPGWVGIANGNPCIMVGLRSQWITPDGAYSMSTNAYDASAIVGYRMGRSAAGIAYPIMCVQDYIAPAPVNGACSATHYACTAGTSANNVSGTTSYTWNCNGIDGGTNAVCSETKPTGTVAVSSNIAASWTITGPATISGSGTAQTSLTQPIGTYTITWGAVSGYTTPASSSLTLVNGGTISFNGIYTSSAVCTGTLPANATTYAGDDTGLSANTARVYAASNTGAKCEYSCNSGYGWNGSSCTVLTPVTTFTGSPTSLAAGGGNVTLNWSITNGAGGGSCTGYSTTNLSGWSTAGTGGKSVTGTNIPITVPSTTTFDLDCWNGIGTAAVRKSVTVTVAAANQVPTAAISAPVVNQSITQGQSITFTGSGTDTDGSISAYRWMDGNCTTGTLLNSTSSFSTSTLSLGAHTVYFSVQDNSGAWSTNCPSRTITVNAACVPTYSYVCTQTGGSCTAATCGQTLATTPDCVKLTTDCGGSQTSVLPSECVSNGVSCSSGSVTCPACPQSNTGNWREVAPGQ